MRVILKYSFYILLITTCSVFPQSKKVLSGPMLSYVDSYGTQIWFLLDGSADNIEIDVRDYENDNLMEYKFHVTNDHNLDEIPFTVSLETLVPNTEYIASIFVDGVYIQDIDIFTKRPHLDDTQFLIGYNLGDTSREIFSHMKKTNSDFMVWIGGHVSFEFPISLDNLISNYMDLRKDERLADFISSMPQIATWNDLDYGLEFNSPLSLQDTSHIAFELFWPNALKKTYNYTFFDYGLYQRYTYNDVDLFLLDAMTFRAEDKSQLYGDKQIERLFQEIKNTGATFTIIASPLPFTFDTEEAYLHYQKEFEHFLYRLEVADLKGLILLSANGQSGTMMNEYKLPKQAGENINNKKSIYEFNISPLNMNNYSLVSISGKRGYRVFSFETYNQNGSLVYRKSLYESDLRLN
mgnify:CR=1 FL=1